VTIGAPVKLKSGLLSRTATLAELSLRGCGLVARQRLEVGAEVRAMEEAVAAAEPAVCALLEAHVVEHLRAEIARGRELPGGGPVFLGPNSLGALSRPGRYDLLFIPPSRLDKHWSAPARRVALVSQSGAFIASRLSNLETLNPAFALSLGNQIDVTVADLLAALGRRGGVDVVGVYAEGFNDLDGQELLRHIAALREAEKTVVFYKAGRTEPGRSAAAGHTAAVAGDYDVCQAAAAQAGALVADTFKEFEQLLELATALHTKTVRGVRIGAMSNAGFETVGMADAIRGQRYEIEMAVLSAESEARLAAGLGLEFPILSDVDRRAIQDWGLVHEAGGPGASTIARPATYIVEPDGTISWRSLTTNWRVRVRPEHVLEALADSR